jgi:hypothetical protein
MFVVPPPPWTVWEIPADSSCKCKIAVAWASRPSSVLGHARPGLRQPEVEHRHTAMNISIAAALCQCGPHSSQTDGHQPGRYLRNHAVNLGSLYVNDFTRFGGLPGRGANPMHPSGQTQPVPICRRIAAPVRWCRWAEKVEPTFETTTRVTLTVSLRRHQRAAPNANFSSARARRGDISCWKTLPRG